GLRKWVGERGGLAAVDLLADAAALASQEPRPWRVSVPMLHLPRAEQVARRQPNFTARDDIATELLDELDSRLPVPVAGLFSYEIKARDAEAAIEVVADVIDRMQTRA